MSYCPNCGTKLEDGDLFCPNCGANTSVKIQNGNGSGGNNTLNSNNFSDILKIIFKMFLKPVTYAKEFIKKSSKNDVIVATILFTAVQGILGMWKTSQIITSLQSETLSILKKIGDIAYSITGNSSNSLDSLAITSFNKEISNVKSVIRMPYGKIFLQSCALFLIAIAVMFIVIYVAANIFCKDKINTFSLYKVVIICSVPILYSQILSIIFSYASFPIGFFIIIVGILISAVCFAVIAKDVLLIDDNLNVMFTAVSYCICIFAVLLCLQNMAGTDISQILKLIGRYIN